MNISLRVVLILTLVLAAAFSCSIIGVLISRAGVASANESADFLRRETIRRKQLEINNFFKTPHSVISALQAASKVRGVFDPKDYSTFLPWLCSMMKLNNGHITYVGTRHGLFAAAEYAGDGVNCYVFVMNANNQSQMDGEYSFTALGTPFETVPVWSQITHTTYDPRQRPWYIATNTTRTMTWSDVYLDWRLQDSVTTVGVPLFDSISQEVVGVIATDFLMRHLVNFLTHSVAVKSGEMILVETSSRHVIGASWNETAVFRDKNCNKPSGEDRDCFRLATIGDIVEDPKLLSTIDALGEDYLFECGAKPTAAPSIIDEHTNFDEPRSMCQATIGNGRDRIFVDVVSISDGVGQDLRLIVMIPESDFLQEVWERSDLAAIISSVVVAAMIAIAVVVVYKVLSPLSCVERRLYTAAMLNDYDSTEDDSRSMFTEVANLQIAYATMVSQLASVRTFVPQSVLQAQGGSAVHDVGISSDTIPHNPLGTTSVQITSHDQDYQNLSKRRTSTAPAAGIVAAPNESRIMTVNLDRINAQVNCFRETVATMMVIQLVRRTATRNLEAFGTECKQFMEATIPEILKSRGVIELQRPSRIVATFDRGVHVERAALCALRIAKAFRRANLLGVTVLHTSAFLSGACGAEARNSFVMEHDFFHTGFKLAALSSKCLHSHVVVTDTVAKTLPVGIFAIPIDHVSGISSDDNENNVLFEIVKKRDEIQAEATIVKSVFSAMLSGNYSDAISKITLASHPLQGHLKRMALISKTALTVGTCEPYMRRYRGWGLTAEEEAIGEYSNHTEPHHSGFSEIVSSDDDDEEVDDRKEIRKAVDAKKVFKVDEEDSNEGNGHDSLFTMAVLPTHDESASLEASANFEGLTPQQNKQFSLRAKELVDSTVPSRFVDIRHNTWLRAPDAPTLGEGAFSKVYLGMNAQGDIVALKCIDLESRAFNADTFIETEVAILSEIHHPNLANFISLAIHKSIIILVLEYVAGGTLRTVIHTYKQLLPHPASKRFALDILRGLQYLHERDVVHGDVKPENVLLGADSVCKLTDFGSAVERHIAACSSQHNGTANVDVFDVRGTAPYMAPEAAQGEMPSPASDMWSFGVLLHELIAGVLPWEHECGAGGAARSQVKLMRGLAKQPDDPGALRPRLCLGDEGDHLKTAAALITACLHEDPAKRPNAKDAMTHDYFL